MEKIEIAGRLIGSGYPPYLIAELSANHNGKLENAVRIIEEAKKAGADAVKLQTYTPDTITIKSEKDDFTVRGGLWDGKTLHELYQEAHLPWDWHETIFEHGRKTGITVFSSVFDSTSVDFLEDLGTPAYKIASFEAIDLPLIKYAAATRKPMIISTGMADADEISEAIEAARLGGCTNLAILHCVSGYPAPPEDYNLRTIPDMIRRFNLVTGLSDHTLDNTTALASVALGASIIEKHFTLDRDGGGPDDSFSLEPPELASLSADIKTAWSALGKIDYGQKSSEKGNKKFRRSLYFVKDVTVGEKITSDAVRSIRPGFGMPPKAIDSVIGRRVVRSVQRGEPVTEDCLAPIMNRLQ